MSCDYTSSLNSKLPSLCLQWMRHCHLQVATDTMALLIAALSVFSGRQTPIMAILLMLLIEVCTFEGMAYVLMYIVGNRRIGMPLPSL